MLGRYIGRLQLNNDNINDFHKIIRSKELVGYSVTKIVTNKKEYSNYSQFEQDMKNSIKLRTIRIILQRKTETIEYYNNKLNTRTWYKKENTNQEYDLTVKKQEEFILYKATKGIELFKYKERDIARGKNFFDLLWILPVVNIPYVLLEGTIVYPFVIMIFLFFASKVRLSLYNVINLK